MLCHLLVYGIDRSCNPWLSHGESVEQIDKNKDQGYVGEVSDNESEDRPFDDMAPFVFDATSAWNYINSTSINENERTTDIRSSSGTSETPMLLQKLMEDMEANLAFNYDNNLPSISYDAKKYTKALGLDYVKIDACVNHCVLFRKEFANEVKCPKCSAPRWKQDISQDDDNSDEDEGVHRKTRVPQLVLRHFPLIPRLQRMFMFSKLAMHMRWNNKGHAGDNDDGIMRHPRDSKSWKSLDELYPEFAADAQPDHKWRLNKRFFSKKVERRAPPNPLSGNDALEKLHGYPNVEFGTLLDLPGKNKDSVNARLDLEP
uniref:Uncharacterized protein n=1 Tax=Chenopodium quinoa TaxID=63459 RepID=A0A803KUJ5_CHEQI